jgi:hypothetical protein
MSVLIDRWTHGGLIRSSSNFPTSFRTIGSNFPWDSYVFPSGSAKYVYGNGIIPYSPIYTASANLQVNIHWIVGVTGGYVRWHASILGRTDDEAYDVAFTDTNSVDDNAGAVGDLMIAQISLASPTISPADHYLLKLWRNASDTNAGDVYVTAAELLIP